MSMKPSTALRPRPADALVALAVVLLAAAVGFFTWGGSSQGGLTAVISLNGQVVDTVSLSALSGPEERTYTGAYTGVVALEPDRVCIREADCPTQDCVATGWVSRPGQSVVCLPNRLSVELRGRGADGVDLVLG